LISLAYSTIRKRLPNKTLKTDESMHRNTNPFGSTQEKPMTAERVLTLLEILRSAGVGAVLDGGWGIDALLGRQTREHEDLDLVVALVDAERIQATLHPLGFALHEDQLPVRFVLRTPAGEQLDFHTVTFDEEGGGLQPQPNGTVFRYPPEGFVRGRIGDCSVACISAGVQILCHLGYEPSPKDGRDVLALCETFGILVPRGYAAFISKSTV
jgi:lincosamide nucleotidyltransferase A/C/D/E